jgi:hypothetical protein
MHAHTGYREKALGTQPYKRVTVWRYARVTACKFAAFLPRYDAVLANPQVAVSVPAMQVDLDAHAR